MIMTINASLIENSSNDQINSQTKVNLRLKNGILVHARFLIGGFQLDAVPNSAEIFVSAILSRYFVAH
jgi:hypothetical protein